LIQIWPGMALPASSLIRSPTSFEPVKSDVPRFGVLHQRIANSAARPVMKFTASLGNARFKKDVNEFRRDRLVKSLAA